MSTPNTTDLQVGLDPTGFTNITGAQLAQLVNSAIPTSDRGFILVSTDTGASPNNVPNVPNAITTPAWQRYFWLRILPTSVVPYVWNPNGATDPTFLNWVTIQQSSFAPNSIPGTALINNSVPATAIISLSYAQITGAPAFAALNAGQTALVSDGILTSNLFSSPNFIWGCLQGSGSSPGVPKLAPGAVISSSIPAQAVSGNQTATLGQIKDNSVTSTQLLNNGGGTIPSFQSQAAVDPGYNLSVSTNSIIGLPSSTNYNLTTQGSLGSLGDVLAVNYNATSNQAGWVRCTRAILTLPDPSNQAGQTIQVNPAGTGYQLALLKYILQFVEVVSTTVCTNSGVLANSTSTPNYNATGMTPAFNSGAIVKVDTTGNSKFFIRVKVNICVNSTTFVGLYAATGATAPVAGATISTASSMTMTCIDYQTGTNPANATYYVAFGIVTGGSPAAYVNSINGSTNPFLISQSSITVEEIL